MHEMIPPPIDNIVDLELVRRLRAARPLHQPWSPEHPQARRCLCCEKPFLSSGPSNRVCTDCKSADTPAAS